jgi:hypothetical protein
VDLASAIEDTKFPEPSASDRLQKPIESRMTRRSTWNNHQMCHVKQKITLFHVKHLVSPQK